MTDSTCLAGETAAANVCDDVELAFRSGNAEGLVDDELHGFQTEVVVDVTAVDGDDTGTGKDADSCGGLLSSARAVEVGLSACIHHVLLLPF